MNPQKLWKLLLLLLLAFSLSLAACDGGTEDAQLETPEEAVDEEVAEEEEAAEEEEVAEEASPESDEAVTDAQAKPSGSLLIWVQQANQDVFEQTVLDDFLAEYPDIQIEWVNYPPDEVASQLQVAIQGGAGAPDLAVTENRFIPRLIELGGLVDLTEQLQPYVDDLNPAAVEFGSKEGRHYSFPWDVGPVVTFYRRDLFEAAGLPTEPAEVEELISTWDKFLDACIQIKEETNANCLALNKANNYGDPYFNMLWQQGLDWVNEEGQIVVDSPQHVATLEKLGEFWEAEVVSDQLEWTDGWYAELNAGLDDASVSPVATVTIGAWMGNFLKTWIAPDQGGNWAVVHMPAWEEGGTRSANQGGSAFIIPELSSNKEAAWAFAEFMVGREDNHLEIFQYSDYFPALESTYDAPLFSEPDPYFGDQVTRQVFVDAAQNIPNVGIYVPENSTITAALQTAVQKVGLGEASAEAALQEAAETARLETGLD